MTDKLSKKDGELLLKLARQTILHKFGHEEDEPGLLKSRVSKKIVEEKRGVFVSLHKKRKLRGCIGNIAPVKTVFAGVVDNAKHAAFNDSRFSPLSYEELKDTRIEVSILTRPKIVDYTNAQDLIAKIRPDIDGVIIKKRHHSATFLPQVWKQLRDPKIFLKHLCQKAGLSSDEWKSGDLIVSTYQVQSFEDVFTPI